MTQLPLPASNVTSLVPRPKYSVLTPTERARLLFINYLLYYESGTQVILENENELQLE